MGVSIPLEFGTKKSEPHRHRIELETPPWGTRLPPGQRRAHPPRAAAPASLTAPRGPPPTLRCRLPQGEADEMGADRPADRPAELSLIEKCAVDALLGAHARFSDLFPVEAEGTAAFARALQTCRGRSSGTFTRLRTPRRRASRRKRGFAGRL